MNIERRAFLAASGVALVAPASAWAQAYPARPVKIVVGYSAGGAVDTVARAIGQAMSANLGQSFVIENKPGAGTNIAVKSVIDAPADGYTLMLAANALAANMALYKPMPFDAERDLVPISLVGRVPVVIAANAALPIDSLAKLIAEAKAKPGALAYATPGNGSTPHMAVEFFERAAGISLQHVPYRGGSQAITDVIGGQVPTLLTTLPNLIGPHQQGKVRVLAFSGERPLATLPGVPTFAEAGYPQLTLSEVFAFFMRSEVPAAASEPLVVALARAAQSERVVQALRKLEFEPLVLSPAELSARLKTESANWRRVVAESGYKVTD